MYTRLIGEILIESTSLTQEQLDEAIDMRQQKKTRLPLGQFLIQESLITPTELAKGLAQQWDLTYLDSIDANQIDDKLVKALPFEYLKKQLVLPVKLDSQTIAVAMADPMNVESYDAVMMRLGQFAQRVVSTPSVIEQAISHYYYKEMTSQGNASDENSETIDQTLDDSQPEDLLNIANKAPVIKLVNNIFFQAVHARASDIHIEPYEDDVKVRLRIDGVLHDLSSLPRQQLAALVSRLKIMSNLDIAERRLPQDGQSRIRIGEKEMDIRCSVVPTSGGERVVLRLLDKSGQSLDLESLGFMPKVKKQFLELIHQPHGIFLVTGPTGSGKTTTLYSILNTLNNSQRNILTVEDPIEYQLKGIGQMQVKPKIDLTFANSLKHILRQDPDVVMVGEIRDEQTARIAIQASLTGHMVLSTLHTNDAPSAFSRLLDMKIEPYLISSSVVGVMAQRLVRLICQDCKIIHEPGTEHKSLLKNTQESFYIGSGCDHCLDTGYLGRTGIFELLVPDDELRELINQKAPAHDIKTAALNKGMVSLRDCGLWKAVSGLTSLQEVMRVTQESSQEVQTALNDEIFHVEI